VVPAGEYCNRCGQGLAGVALKLQQLALAGEDFMVTLTPPVAPATSATPAPPPAAEELAPLVPDESVELEDAELPDWLEELPAAAAPAEVRERIYPALRPVEPAHTGSQQTRFLAAVVVLLVLMLISLVGLALILLFQGGA
jgi:cytochrome c-type biogenesis protein CcmH/NrfG